MLGYLEGIVQFIDRDSLIIVNDGVGYKVKTPQELLVYSSQNLGEKLKLFIHTHVKEDALELFGFTTQSDLILFEHLISVSGVGPKTALNVFSAGEAAQISKAISSNDVEFFTSVSGIGKKGAQRIIVELKGKLSGDQSIDLDAQGESSQIIEALSSMGFSRPEISAALKKLDRSQPLETQISQALKNLSS